MSVSKVKTLLGRVCKSLNISNIEPITDFIIRISDKFVFRICTQIQYVSNNCKYDAVSNPYKRINIKPNDIEYITKNVLKSPKYGLGRIENDWNNEEAEHISKDYKIKGIKQKYLQEKKWENTVYFQTYKQKKNFTEEDIWKKLKYIEELYNDIKNNGYQVENKGSRWNGYHSYRELLEVIVSIDQNGEIYLQDGRHRFAIAQILDLEIPAQVVCRHKQWQELRDNIYNKDSSTKCHKLQDHPDLQDVLN